MIKSVVLIRSAAASVYRLAQAVQYPFLGLDAEVQRVVPRQAGALVEAQAAQAGAYQR